MHLTHQHVVRPLLNSSFPLPSAVQDYPSLALMSEKMSDNNINLVFAVTNYVYPLYKVKQKKTYSSCVTCGHC